MLRTYRVGEIQDPYDEGEEQSSPFQIEESLLGMTVTQAICASLCEKFGSYSFRNI